MQLDRSLSATVHATKKHNIKFIYIMATRKISSIDILLNTWKICSHEVGWVLDDKILKLRG